MPDLPKFQDLFRAARDEALIRNAKLSREAVEREGTDANVLIAAGAAIGDEVVGQVSDLQAALFLTSAVGEDLDRLVFDRYGLVRKAAASSRGSVQFTTTAASPTTFPLASGTVLQAVSGIQSVATEDSVFSAGSIGPVTVAVRSVLAGATQNAKIGEITSIVSGIPGAPNDLKVTNPYATAGAADAETDDSLRERARRYFVTARRGTIAALEETALSVPGVLSASAYEVIDQSGRAARQVQLVISDQFTEQFVEFDVVPPRYQTQSQALTVQVVEALEDMRAAGVYVGVFVASVVVQPVQLTLTFQAGASVNDAALQARAAVVNYVNALAPGKPFVLADLLATIRLVPGLTYTGAEVYSPLGDITAKPLQVIRTSLGLVTAVASQTDRPITTGQNPDAFALTE